jgi:hypothetical protein
VKLREQWILVFVVATSACASAASINRDRLGEVRQRAAFDLHCDANSLKLTPLKEQDDVVMQYGVEGCNQRSVYVHTWSGWVLNAADEGAPRK